MRKISAQKGKMIALNLFYFFGAFAVGMFIVYISTPPPQVILKFPSPYNAGKVIYSDKADNCYKYSAQDVACPLDTNLIKPQPILEDFRAKSRRLGAMSKTFGSSR